MRKIFEITLGIILVILGLIGGLIPVLQGWMFGIPGLILLARHFDWAKRILGWAKRKWEAAKAGGPSAGAETAGQPGSGNPVSRQASGGDTPDGPAGGGHA